MGKRRGWMALALLAGMAALAACGGRALEDVAQAVRLRLGGQGMISSDSSRWQAGSGQAESLPYIEGGQGTSSADSSRLQAGSGQAESLPYIVPEGVEVGVLLGADTLERGSGLTDTIILIFFHRENGKASLVSIPRDLWVAIPGLGAERAGRINTVFAKGGFALLADTLDYNLGVRPQFYVLAHLHDFIRLVDELGGLAVPVEVALPEDCGGIPAGEVQMSGATALCYVRSRFSTSDFDRSRRQREVLQVLLRRLLEPQTLAQTPAWYERYHASVQTNLGLPDLLGGAPLALRVKEGGFSHFALGLVETDPYQDPASGASVLLLRPQEAALVFEQALQALEALAPVE